MALNPVPPSTAASESLRAALAGGSTSRRSLVFQLAPLLALAPALASAQSVSGEYKRALMGPFADERWDAILNLARSEGEVRWWMWNGDKNTNIWVDEFCSRVLLDTYGIKFRRVGVNHPQVFMKQLEQDMKHGVANGQIDLVWINGENFRIARKQDLLWGPFAHHLPNFIRYVDQAKPEIASDFGFPTQGFETVYSKAQLVFYYDTARVKAPPTNLVQLVRWVREHPGRFTYPQVRDYTGSAFVRTVFLHTNTTGGTETFLEGSFDADLMEQAATSTWAYLNGLKPYLWSEGKQYPQTIGEVDELFQKGQIDFTLSYSPLKGANMIKVGAWPETVRSFVLAEGTLRNANFVAIPFNARNKAAAMVLANLIMSPEFQILSGTMMGIEYSKLNPKQQAVYQTRLGGSPAVLPLNLLDRQALPEIPEEYVKAIEAGWEKNVGNVGGKP